MKVSAARSTGVFLASMVGCALLGASPAHGAEMVGHWALDETVQGSTVVDSGTGGNNGTPSGTGGGPSHSTDIPPVSFSDPGSYFFNGIDQYVQIASNFRSAVSVTFWFKPEANGPGNGDDNWYNGTGLFDAEIAGVTDDFGVTWSANHVEFGIGKPDTTIHSGALSLDTWHQVSATWEKSDGAMKLYIDGSLVDSTIGSTDDRISTGVRFGSLLSGANARYDGYMDDIRTYDVALDPAQVDSLAAGNAVDDPSITLSFSPADDATGVATSTDLSLSISTTTVATSTGAISLRKTADDSLVESFAVDSPRITRTQDATSTTFVIDPTAALAENTGYYISYASTTFAYGSSSFLDGTASSTWNFTTGDFTPPVLSSVTATSTASTTASISWDTNEAASTQVAYGLTGDYGTLTAETDTSPRITSGHSVSLSSLLPCTTYHAAAVSRDAAENTATSTDQAFTTPGCVASSTPTVATSTSVSSTAGGQADVTDAGKTFTVQAPANATATSSSFVIQVKALPSASVLDSIGLPSPAPNAVGTTVFDVKAIINGDTILDSFDQPVTISYQYTDGEVSGLDESSLKLYHYHDGSWDALDSCSVDTGSNTITCTTPSFSIFGLFGTKSTASGDILHPSGGSVQSQVANLIAMGNAARAAQIEAQWPTLFPHAASAPAATASTSAATSGIPVRDLTVGMQGSDVKDLQQLLIAQGYAIPAGPTSYFFSQTKAALAAYQKAHGINPPAGYFGPLTRAQMKAAGLDGLWW